MPYISFHIANDMAVTHTIRTGRMLLSNNAYNTKYV